MMSLNTHTHIHTHTCMQRAGVQNPVSSRPTTLNRRMHSPLQPSPGVHVYMLACVLNRFSRVQLFATLWTVAHQAPLSMVFFRKEYWYGLPFSPPGDPPNPGIVLAPPVLQVES